MSSAGTGLENVRSLRRQRVLVITRDRRYLRTAGFLLARAGFAVDRAERVSEALELVDRHQPDVVVVDASGSVPAAARLAAAIEGLRPGARVFVVSENEEGSLAVNLRLFPKWSVEALVSEVARFEAAPDEGFRAHS
jgi:ActR/RegA family two-component response regulator